MGQTRKRQHNRGLRKICECPRRTWAKCPHSWHFNFKPKGGPSFRFSVDSEAGKHIEYKSDAETLAESWRSQIRAGTFRRTVDQVKTSPVVNPDVMTLAKFGETYFDRRGKPASAGERSYMSRLKAFTPKGADLYSWRHTVGQHHRRCSRVVFRPSPRRGARGINPQQIRAARESDVSVGREEGVSHSQPRC